MLCAAIEVLLPAEVSIGAAEIQVKPASSLISGLFQMSIVEGVVGEAKAQAVSSWGSKKAMTT